MQCISDHQAGDELHAAAVEHAKSVMYWRGVAAQQPKGSPARRHALRVARHGEGLVFNLGIRAETDAWRADEQRSAIEHARAEIGDAIAASTGTLEARP